MSIHSLSGGLPADLTLERVSDLLRLGLGERDSRGDHALDFATRCRDATMALQKCMEDHREYYKDFLADAEEAVAEKVAGGGGGGEVEEGEREKEEKKKEEES